jgi:hypothetical protein
LYYEKVIGGSLIKEMGQLVPLRKKLGRVTVQRVHQSIHSNLEVFLQEEVFSYLAEGEFLMIFCILGGLVRWWRISR